MLRGWSRAIAAGLVVGLFLVIASNLRTVRPYIKDAETFYSGSQSYREVLHFAQEAVQSTDGGALIKTPSEEADRPQVDEASDATTNAPGNVPADSGLSKMIVMGALLSEDTSWVQSELPAWRNAIYTVDLPPDTTDSPTGYRTPTNRGREAMPYLSYIIDHYDNLPDINVFLHAHRSGWPTAWHTEGPYHDSVRMLKALRLEAVQQRGYTNLRCSHAPGCPDEVQPFRQPVAERKAAELAFPYVYSEFFGTPFSVMEEEIKVVAAPCCAQFAVTGERIRQRPREEYERFRLILERLYMDDDTLGRILEYLWHIIFGMEVVDCPDEVRCACELYGRCGIGKGRLGH